MTAYEIPLSPVPQTFLISLGDLQVRLTFKWNYVAGYWVLDIEDPVNGPMVTGIPVVTGVDLLEPYGYLGFTGQLIVQSQANIDDIPTLQTLGGDGLVFYVTE